MAAAVPFALKAGIPLAMSLFGKKLSGPSKTQTGAMQGTEQSASQLQGMAPPLMQQGAALTQQGSGQLGQGARQLGQAGDYYSSILSNRRAATQSLAPEMTTALDFYRGAEQKAGRTMRGGSRDYAMAELDRQKVGQMAGFLPAARANAAQGMERVGSATGQLGATSLYGGGNLTGQGVNAAANAGYLRSGQFQQATQLQDQQQQGGKMWGQLAYDLAQSMPWGKHGGVTGRGGGGTIPGIAGTLPNLFHGF